MIYIFCLFCGRCLSLNNLTGSVLQQVILCNECIVKLCNCGGSSEWRKPAVGNRLRGSTPFYRLTTVNSSKQLSLVKWT
jgi:hypothetical protein